MAVDTLRTEISGLENSLSAIQQEKRVTGIRRDHCITVGSQFAAKSSAQLQCQDVPLYEYYYTEEQKAKRADLVNQINAKNAQLAREIDEQKAKEAEQVRLAEQKRLDELNRTPNASSFPIKHAAPKLPLGKLGLLGLGLVLLG